MMGVSESVTGEASFFVPASALPVLSDRTPKPTRAPLLVTAQKGKAAMELPPTPRARVDIFVDAHPDTEVPAVCFYYRLMDEEATSVTVWYSLEEIRDVAQQVQRAVAELEQITGKDKDEGNGTSTPRLG